MKAEKRIEIPVTVVKKPPVKTGMGDCPCGCCGLCCK
jgi:hypothetical protein